MWHPAVRSAEAVGRLHVSAGSQGLGLSIGEGQRKRQVEAEGGGSQLSGGIRWGQLLTMLLPREEPKVMALMRCNQHLPAHGGLQVLIARNLEGELVQKIPNSCPWANPVTNVQINHQSSLIRWLSS